MTDSRRVQTTVTVTDRHEPAVAKPEIPPDKCLSIYELGQRLQLRKRGNRWHLEIDRGLISEPNKQSLISFPAGDHAPDFTAATRYSIKVLGELLRIQR